MSSKAYLFIEEGASRSLLYFLNRVLRKNEDMVVDGLGQQEEEGKNNIVLDKHLECLSH